MVTFTANTISALLLFGVSHLPFTGVTATAQDLSEETLSTTSYNYLYPPESFEAATWVDTSTFMNVEELELVSIINRAENEIRACQKLRQDMESLIGTKTGPHNVHIGWVELYKSCLKTRSQEVRLIEKASRQVQQRLIANTGDEGATTTLELIYKLEAKTAGLKKEITKEYRTQMDFIRYYNSGKKEY